MSNMVHMISMSFPDLDLSSSSSVELKFRFDLLISLPGPANKGWPGNLVLPG